MDRVYKIAAIFLLCILILSFTGCRQRITLPLSSESLQDLLQTQEQKESTEGNPQDGQSEENDTDDPADTPPDTSTQLDAQDDSRVPENLEAPSDDSKQSNTENNQNGDGDANVGDPDGDNNAEVVDPSDETGKTTLDHDKGSTVQTIVDQYTDLLEQGVGTLYPCQVHKVYFETVTDYLIVGKGSTEHQMILDSGGLNSADMLRSDALNVGDDWVIQKNPDAIVKCVDASVLGSAVYDTAAAAQAYAALCSRPGWETLSAVTYGNVILLSEELLETEEGQLAAKLYIASAMYPTLFSNVDLNAYCTTIFGENCGIYAYLE